MIIPCQNWEYKGSGYWISGKNFLRKALLLAPPVVLTLNDKGILDYYISLDMLRNEPNLYLLIQVLFTPLDMVACALCIGQEE